MPGCGEVPAVASCSPTSFSCPRISPAAFFGVWTLTYTRSRSNRSAASFEIFTCPVWPDLQGPHNGTSTAPATPALPLCTCAPIAFPVSPEKVSFHLRRRADPFSVTVAANVPFAAAAPFGFGTSTPGPSDALYV